MGLANNKNEADIVGNYKPDHLYTAKFRDGAGKFFNIVTLDDGNTSIEYHQSIPTNNRVKLTVTFIKERNDIKEVSFKGYKQYKHKGWVEQEWEPGEPVTFSYFSFKKLIAFLPEINIIDTQNFGNIKHFSGLEAHYKILSKEEYNDLQ